MKTTCFFCSTSRFLTVLLLVLGIDVILQAQQNAQDFIRWRLKTLGSAYLSYDDSTTLYFTVDRPGANQAILAVDATSGQPKWAYTNIFPYMSISGGSSGVLCLHAGGAGFRSNVTVALKAENGESIWHIISPAGQPRTELQQGVFLLQSGNIFNIYELFRQRDPVFHDQPNPFIPSDPLTSEDLLSKIVALDLSTGNELWRIYLDTVGQGYSFQQFTDLNFDDAPFCVRGNIVFLGSSFYIAAANVNSGKLFWVNWSGHGRENDEDIIPEIEGRTCFFGGPDISALDILTGQTRWTYPLDSLFRARLLLKNESILLAEVQQFIDPLRTDSTNYSLLALDMNSGDKLWQTATTGTITAISKRGKYLQLRIENAFTQLDFYTGQLKNQIDLGDLQVWPSPDGSFLLSGGKDSIIALLRPDGTLIDTLHLNSPVSQVFTPKNGPFLIVSLVSGEIIALEKQTSPSPLPTPVLSAEDLIAQTQAQPLPIKRTIAPSGRIVVEDYVAPLRKQRLGFCYQYTTSQLCTKEGCTQSAANHSFGFAYKKYYRQLWAVQLEMYFLQRGGKGSLVNQVDHFEYDLRYLDFNLLVEVGTLADRPLRLYFLAGPYYAYPLRADYTIKRENGTVNKFPFSAHHDWGMVGGFGLDLNWKKYFIFAEYRAQLGLQSIVGSDELPAPGAKLARGKNSAGGLTLGVGVGF